MNVKEAILGFSQSEKIKSGIIWASQAFEIVKGLPEAERPGGEKAVKAIIDMVVYDIRLAKNLAADTSWEDIESCVDRAVVMIDSGVASESVVHLTRALSKVTTIGHRSMSFLKERGLL